MDVDSIFRLIAGFVLVVAFVTSGYFRMRARAVGEVIDRRNEGTLVLLLRMGSALPLLVVLVLNIVYPSLVNWSKYELPLFLRWFGVAAAIFCVPLLIWVFRSIGGNISETVLTKQNHELVMSGPYQRVRHPLYSSALLLLFSMSFMLEDWFVLIYAIVGAFIFRYLVIPAEESNLIEVFGERYVKYQKQTGAMIPRF